MKKIFFLLALSILCFNFFSYGCGMYATDADYGGRQVTKAKYAKAVRNTENVYCGGTSANGRYGTMMNNNESSYCGAAISQDSDGNTVCGTTLANTCNQY